jgi:hypothetical protein
VNESELHAYDNLNEIAPEASIGAFGEGIGELPQGNQP